MEVIPVIDLKHGRVVHARRGERERYQPLRSTLAPGADPVEIAAALLRLHPFCTLYLADLDAIQRTGDNRGAIAAIRVAVPQVELWVDAGIADLAAYRTWQAQDLGRSVIGTECRPEAALIAALRGAGGDPSPVLSLDYGAHGPLGPAELFGHPSAWPDDVIVMTLARIGARDGPDLRTLCAIIGQAGTRRIFAAGGVRGPSDLTRLREIGAVGALVASSLHDGRLTAAELTRIAAV